MHNRRSLGLGPHFVLVFSCVAIGAALIPDSVGARVTHPGGTISSNQTWLASDTVHIVTGDIRVASGVKLTIQPGCIVKFAGNLCSLFPGLTIDGTLSAVGTVGAPIMFTSYRDDSPAAGGDTNGDGSGTSANAG